MDVRIACTGSTEVSLSELNTLQGNLKELTEVNYQKLKKSILERGFLAPFFLFEIDGKKMIGDGHARELTLTRMKTEGISMPDNFPAVKIEADNIQDAKAKLLAITSQFNTVHEQGLYEFITDAELDFGELSESFNFDAIDFKHFDKNFFSEPEEKKEQVEFEANTSKIIECPSCGLKFEPV